MVAKAKAKASAGQIYIGAMVAATKKRNSLSC